MFKIIRLNTVVHSDGWCVASKERNSLSYRDEHGEVTIFIDAGPEAVAIWPKSMRRLKPDKTTAELTTEEKSVILPRIIAAGLK